jgi:hypothetical protein
MPYLLAGPFVALVGIVAVFFVLRRKSVEKRSMYSARRSQIEHKVRAARQRTLTPRGHAQKPAEQTIPGATQLDAAGVQPTAIYQVPAYEAPPAAPSPFQPQDAPAQAPWDLPAAPAAAAGAPTFDYRAAPPAEPAYTPPAAPDGFGPDSFGPAAPAPAQPSDPIWTPAPAPSEPAVAETMAPAAASSASAGGWSIVTTDKESTEPTPDGKKKDRAAAADASGGSWSLASGDTPGGLAEEDEPHLKRPSGTVMAVAQYAVLVVGLVMVLIGVLVMVANSHVT